MRRDGGRAGSEASGLGKSADSRDDERCWRPECKRRRRSWIGRLLGSRGYHLNGVWYCSERCLALQVVAELEQMGPRLKRPTVNLSRPKIGLILIDSGLITPEQLELAIREQRRNRNAKLGEWLHKLGFISERDITMALSNQYGLSWINLERPPGNKHALSLVPPQVAISLQVLPLDYDRFRNELSVALSDPATFVMLKGVKKMLRCEVSAFVADKSKIEKFIAELYGDRTRDDETNQQARDGESIASIVNFILERAVAIEPDDILIEPCLGDLWIRFWKGDSNVDYFVRLSPQVFEEMSR